MKWSGPRAALPLLEILQLSAEKAVRYIIQNDLGQSYPSVGISHLH